MRVLALEPFYGGSHRAFLDGWIKHSRHKWTVIGLTPRHWKWRMRHAAMTFARMIETEMPTQSATTYPFDVIFTSSMTDIATLRGLLSGWCDRVPIVVYFHENQLTYPNRIRDDRDEHFAYSNILSTVATDAVWFNSMFHRDEFASAAEAFLRRMPDHQHLDELQQACAMARVLYPGCGISTKRTAGRNAGPLRITWAARWEHDKNPELLLEALVRVESAGIDYRLNVMGEEFARRPPAFDEIQTRFADRVEQFGFVESRAEYERVLAGSDVFVSTANHEFFGLSVVEAIMAGAYPLLPNRLAYPELLSQCVSGIGPDGLSPFLYDETSEGLARRIIERAQHLQDHESVWPTDERPSLVTGARAVFGWPSAARELDDALDSVRDRE